MHTVLYYLGANLITQDQNSYFFFLVLHVSWSQQLGYGGDRVDTNCEHVFRFTVLIYSTFLLQIRWAAAWKKGLCIHLNSIWYRFFEVLSASITEHLQNSFTLTKLLVLNKAITGSPVNFGTCAGLLHCLTEQFTLLAYAHFMLSCYTSLLQPFSLIPRLCARMFAPHLGMRLCTPYAQLSYCMLKYSYEQHDCYHSE